jgi:peptidyl-tRNA hydrolase ICT1
VQLDKLQIKYAKSSGPGGQAVNKRSTKVEVRINLKTCDWIPEEVKQQFYTFDTAQINQEGDFIVTSQRHRSRDDNQRDAIAKLEQYIKDAEAKTRGEMTKDEKFYSKVLRNRARADRRRRSKTADKDSSVVEQDSASISPPAPQESPVGSTPNPKSTS